MKNKTTKLGYQKDSTFSISEHVKNQHIAVLGGSGSGKTSEITMLAVQAAEAGELVVEFNMRNCLRPDCLMESVRQKYESCRDKRLNVTSDLTLPLFKKQDGESDHAVIHRVTSLLAQAGNLTPVQTTYLRDAVSSIYEANGYEKEGIRAIRSFLECQEERAAKNVAGKLRSILDDNLIRDGADPFDTASGILELDFNDLQYDDQLVAVNLVLDYLLRKAEAGAFVKRNISLVLDECQNFAYSQGSTMYTLLNESRRLGIRLILAATELSTNKAASVVEQCGTVLYFAPTPTSRKKIAKKIAPQDVQRWVFKLAQLKVGQFAAVGAFVDEKQGRMQSKPIVLDSFIPKLCIEKNDLSEGAVIEDPV